MVISFKAMMVATVMSRLSKIRDSLDDQARVKLDTIIKFLWQLTLMQQYHDLVDTQGCHEAGSLEMHLEAVI
jgi:hypothetical protein